MLALIGASWTDKAYALGTAIFWFALIFALLAVAVTLVRKYRETGSLLGSWRDRTAQDTEDPSELLSKFRDLHSRGTLSDGEYRTIKSKLASQIQAGLEGSRSQATKLPRPSPEVDT